MYKRDNKKIAKFILKNPDNTVIGITFVLGTIQNALSNVGKFMDGAYIKATSGRESLFRMDDGNSVNSFEVKDLSDNLLTAARAHGVVRPDQTDASALPSLIRQFGDQFAIGKTYEVDDPATGSKKTITIDEEMMETWATEAKKAKVSPFMRWLSDRLTSDANIKS